MVKTADALRISVIVDIAGRGGVGTVGYDSGEEKHGVLDARGSSVQPCGGDEKRIASER